MGTPGANTSLEYLLELTESEFSAPLFFPLLALPAPLRRSSLRSDRRSAGSRPKWVRESGGPTPPGMPDGPAFDCSWRRLAFAYAPTLQNVSAARAKELHDALELEALCGEAFEFDAAQAAPLPRAAAPPKPPAKDMVFVSPKGDDKNVGTHDEPVQTLPGALARSRKLQKPVSIVLRGGTYHLDSRKGLGAVTLGPADSGTTIVAYEGEEVVLSGGVLLVDLKWKPGTGKMSKVHVAKLTVEQDAMLPPGGATALRVGGKRATRARFPNANPERDLFPNGYITTKTEWVPPVYPPYNTNESRPCSSLHTKLCGPSETQTIPVDGKEWHGMYQNYTVGHGGAVSAETVGLGRRLLPRL